MMNIRQHVYIPFVLPTMAVKSPLILVCMSPSFIFSFFPKSCSISFWLGLAVPQLFVVLLYKSLNNSGEEKIIHVQFMSYIFSLCSKCCHSCMSTCNCISCTFSIFAWIHSPIVCVSIRVTKFADFYLKLFVFVWDILFKNGPSLEEHNDFNIVKCSGGL